MAPKVPAPKCANSPATASEPCSNRRAVRPKSWAQQQDAPPENSSTIDCHWAGFATNSTRPPGKRCRSWAAPGAARPNPSPGRTGCKRGAGATGQSSSRLADRRNRFGFLRRWRSTPEGIFRERCPKCKLQCSSIWKSLEEILENLVELKQQIFVICFFIICFKISISNGDFSEMTRISQEIFGKMTLNYQAVKK